MNKNKVNSLFATSSNKKIQTILDNFNFENVHDAMVRINWTWGMGDEEHLPSIAELKKVACKLLEYTYQSKVGISTGGFEAEYSGQGNDGLLTLKFVLEESFAG
jgi:hypothetical protein